MPSTRLLMAYGYHLHLSSPMTMSEGSVALYVRFSAGTKKVPQKVSAMNLHLGCGKRYIPGFVHVDLGEFPHIDYRADIRSLPMFPDNSVDIIYSCHVLEYFDREEVNDVLKEWRRILAPAGKLFTAVPDFEQLAALYRETRDLNLVLGPIYGRWPLQTNETKYPIFHRTGYDFTSLERVLAAAGFERVRRFDWRSTFLKDHDDYSQAYFPHMDKENGRLLSLNVVADK
jgi:predicted SAM-dependent methyltransferase